MRGRRFGRRRSKRTVAWIDGLTGFDAAGPSQHKRVTFTQVVAGSTIWGAAVQLTVPGDLSLHGGEDAVITRVVGRLCLFNGLRDSGAGAAANSFFVRCVVAQTDIYPAGVSPIDFTTSAGLGQDDILWTHETFVSSIAQGTVGLDAMTSPGPWFDVNIKAKRKLQSDRQLVLWFQTLDANTLTSLTMEMAGGLRMLLMRPR